MRWRVRPGPRPPPTTSLRCSTTASCRRVRVWELRQWLRHIERRHGSHVGPPPLSPAAAAATAIPPPPPALPRAGAQRAAGQGGQRATGRERDAAAGGRGRQTQRCAERTGAAAAAAAEAPCHPAKNCTACRSLPAVLKRCCRPPPRPWLQYAALEARAQQLQDDLTAAYKEKAALAEQSLQATRQLQVVRDITERQARELGDAADEARRLREQVGCTQGWQYWERGSPVSRPPLRKGAGAGCL